ncbi:uncharacterized protein A1O5_08299 [Cladophialophora psammophila CBS 110553]|uniref:Transcription factor domain-containing protein n=1 Tax=Cladophialophora psammophila CBS 110553 TaxID=1182543 RepID=W9WV38_9EURO|nr:uncharacterized protein A1O5_08299 [Cladophialophora psammophila CBS 110553]EXJ68506.1 hypothetical protein A1O5_08299 [Cladophialophora psammophila CBS 110553]
MRSATAHVQLTFIVQTKDRLSDGDHLCRVNSHVANYSHRRRRLDPKDARQTDRARKCRSVRLDERETLHSRPGALSHLGQGAGDPFNSLPVTVNPTINYVISFNRLALTPSPVNSQFEMQRARKWTNQYDHDTRSALQDEILAYAHLNRLIAVVAFVTTGEPFQRLALIYKNQTMSKLQNLIRAHKVETTEPVCDLIASLYTAEIAAHNFEAAAVHGRMLRYMLQPGRPVDISERLARFILWQDVHRASMTLTPTFLDLCQYAQNYLPRIPNTPVSWGDLMPSRRNPIPCVIDGAMQCAVLRGIFKETRLYYSVSSILIEDNLPAEELLFTMSIRHGIMQGHLVNNYVRCAANIQTFGVERDPFSFLHCKAWATLATLLWIRFAGYYEMQIPPRPPLSQSRRIVAVNVPEVISVSPSSRDAMYSSAPVIIMALRRHLEDSKASTLAIMETPLIRARLWAIFVGAVAEQAQEGFDGSQFGGKGNWHNLELTELAFLMGLSTWSEVRLTLEGFLYLPNVGLAAAEWFEWFAERMTLGV